MKKTGKIGSILCLLALLGLTGIYALPKVYVLYQANTGKVDICLKEYMLEEGKEVPWKTEKMYCPVVLYQRFHESEMTERNVM